MIATELDRALQVSQHQLSFIDAFGSLVQDEPDRRKSRLLERRFALSGLPERKDLKDFDFSYNPRLPERDILQLAVARGYTVLYREAHTLIDDRHQARELGDKNNAARSTTPPSWSSTICSCANSPIPQAMYSLTCSCIVTKNTPRSSA